MIDNTSGVDLVDVFEEMLCQRAMKGLRPVLYVSSMTDLECNMLMLLDESSDELNFGQMRSRLSGASSHITTN
jgi:hypothetical protein